MNLRRLKEGIWLEPVQALLMRKTHESWTERHRKVMRKRVMEEGCVQTRCYYIGWLDKKKCQGCVAEEETEKAQSIPVPSLAQRKKHPQKV